MKLNGKKRENVMKDNFKEKEGSNKASQEDLTGEAGVLNLHHKFVHFDLKVITFFS